MISVCVAVTSLLNLDMAGSRLEKDISVLPLHSLQSSCSNSFRPRISVAAMSSMRVELFRLPSPDCC